MALIPMFPKVPTQADRDRLLALLRKREAAAEARQHRHKGMRRYLLPRHPVGGRAMFAHLPRDKQTDARARFERYKLAHRDKIAKLGGLSLVRYLGCLAACAAAHATRVEQLDSHKARNIKRHSNAIRSYLGKQEKHPFTIVHDRNPDGSFRNRRNDGGLLAATVAAVHPGHGKPVEAEAGQVNLEGI